MAWPLDAVRWRMDGRALVEWIPRGDPVRTDRSRLASAFFFDLSKRAGIPRVLAVENKSGSYSAHVILSAVADQADVRSVNVRKHELTGVERDRLNSKRPLSSFH